jgi:hypothetical protein
VEVTRSSETVFVRRAQVFLDPGVACRVDGAESFNLRGRPRKPGDTAQNSKQIVVPDLTSVRVLTGSFT